MQENNQSGFGVVTTSGSSKKGKQGLIVTVLIVILLVAGVVAGVLLVKQQQNIQEKAAAALVCPAAEACPVAGQGSLLKSCTAVAGGNIPVEISCSLVANVGTMATCGANKYCCPSLGASWTTNISLCTSPSPTPVSTLGPTATISSGFGLTASPSATPTMTATATATATAVPIPVTGINWPTLVGAGVGIFVIIGSVLLVL